MLATTVLITSCLLTGCSCIKGYYWREYSGAIPKDALVGGKDISGQNVYIGQTYMKNGGLMPVQITPGVMEVWTSLGGPKSTSKYIKILCGRPENFYWMRSKKDTLHLDLAGKHAVIGGQEDTYGIANIGRISDEGDTKIGKVNSFFLEDASFYYINNNKEEKLLGTFEILIYEERRVDSLQNTVQELFSDL